VRKRSKIQRVVFIGLVCLLPPAGPISGQQGDFVGINQQVRAFQNRPPLSQNQASKKLWAWTENGGFPYVEIYHFPAEAGSRYTLVLTYAADKARRRIIITGENPFSDEKLQLPQGARTCYPQDLTTHPAPAGAAPCRETRRFNFTVEAKSNTRGLYLVCLAREPAAALEFRLKFPADPDADVKAYTAMPDCAWLGKIYWGKIVDDPIFMAAVIPPPPADKPELVSLYIKRQGEMLIGNIQKFIVPAGMKAYKFHAANQINSETKGWRIFHSGSDGREKVDYEYGLFPDLNTKQTVEKNRPPLGTLILPPGSYYVNISGREGSTLNLDYYLKISPLP